MQFLSESAEYIFKKHSLNTLQDILVVLPTRRSSFFFKKELSKLSKIPFFSPLVYSIDDFIVQFSGIEKAEQIDLLLLLFQCFKKEKKDLEFNDFINFAPTVLKDFDLIDQSLYDKPEELFNYMSELKALERWDIKELPENSREATRNYFGFHSLLAKVYTSFTASLKKQGIGNNGIIYRHLAENVDALLLNQSKFDKIYFIGLNSLSPAEEKIVEKTVSSKKGECLWDSDDYYMLQNKKAGEVLREYKYSGKFGPWNFQSDNLKQNDLEVNLVGTNSDVYQARILNEILEKEGGENTVIVVLDENIIQPLLISGIPESISDFNITMGLPLKNGMETLFFNSYIDFQSELNDRINANSLLDFFNQPIFRLFESEKIKNLKFFLEQNKIHFIKKEEVLKFAQGDNFLSILFANNKNEVQNLINNCLSLHALIKEALLKTENSIEIEFSSIIERILARISSIYQKYNLTIESFRTLFNEQVRSQKVPFTGQPIAQLQVMSMLETRCLDFDTIFILNFNEGNLPAKKRIQSFMPLDLLISEKLPYYSNQEAIMSYHFFRLLQRTKKAFFFYLINSRQGVGGMMEKSRFIMQVEEELKEYNPSLKINYLTASQIEGKNIPDSKIIVTKEKEVLEELRNYFFEGKGLSASSLQNLIECHLRFYWQNIKKIRPQPRKDDLFESNDLGTILHETLEVLDNELIESKQDFNSVNATKLKSKIEPTVYAILKEKYRGFEFEYGINRIFIDQLIKSIQKYFENQIESGREYQVLATETNLQANIKLEINDESRIVNLNGKIDRIELDHFGNITLSDYKSGIVKKSELNTIKNEAEFEASNKKIIRQLLIYLYLFENSDNSFKNKLKGNLNARIYSFRNLNENLIYENNDTQELFKSSLESLIEQIINPDLPIEQTDNIKHCTYCDFIEMCQRKPSNF